MFNIPGFDVQLRPDSAFKIPRITQRAPQRRAAALAELRTLQAEYEAWRDQLPGSLADSRTAELLEGVYDVDLDALRRRAPAGVRDATEQRSG